MVRTKILLGLIFAASVTAAGCGLAAAQEGEGKKDEASSEEESGGASGRGPLLTHVESGEPIIEGSTYVSPLVEVFGDVYIGERSFVAGNTVLRAHPDERLTIGSETNAQDNVVLRSLESSTYVSDRTSLAHHAIVRDSEIGDFAFVGFLAEVIDSEVGEGALISAHALVEGVKVPEDALISPGQEVTTQREADDLPKVGEAEEEFKSEVLDVNAEFAEGYVELYEDVGYDGVVGIGPNPVTEFNQERIEPEIGDNADVGEFARIVGDVRIGSGAEIGQRAAIRADEGAPIIIGKNADIEDRVTFHALKGTSIEVGDGLDAGNDAVLHGPLKVGDGLTTDGNAVVFRADVGDDVTVGEDAIIQGPAGEDDPNELNLKIPDGTNVPDGAVITGEDDLRELEEE